MTKEELLKKLADYAKKVNTGIATTADHSEVKGSIQAAYDAGSIPQDLKGELGKKATFSFKNMLRSPELEKLPGKIVEKGGSIGKFAEAEAPVLGKVVDSASKAGGFGKKMHSFGPLLGMLGAGAMAMGAGQKAMAGDIPGAAGDAADLATDYIPGVSQAKLALSSSPLGEGSDVTKDKEQFDFSPYKTSPKPESEIPAEALENPLAEQSKFSELKKKLQPGV